MDVIIRTDASTLIGTGHVMRCLSLADVLRGKGASVQFVCRLFEGHLGDLIRDRGYGLTALAAPTRELPSGASSNHQAWLGASLQDDANETSRAISTLDAKPDWLIVDHYGVDSRWERLLRAYVGRIMIIDDLANRTHDCDLLLDQNLYEGVASRYVGKVPERCQLLLGPRYALLREEFRKARDELQARSGTVRRILVLFGGLDPANHTLVAIESLARIGLQNVHIDVVIGTQQRNRDEIEAACSSYNIACHVQTSRIAELMSEADLAIGAGGSTTWERCCMGLPCLTFALAENQRQLVHDAALAGLLYAPNADPSDCDALAQHLKACIENPLLLAAMSRRGLATVDGRGAERVLRAMGVFSVSIREAVRTDSERIFEWRNHPEIRRVSRNSSPLDREAHETWFESVLSDPDRLLLIGESAGEPVGVVRFDVIAERAMLSIYRVPGHDGRGLGAELLLAAEQWLSKSRPDVRCLRAEVLDDNVPSHALFGSAGYKAGITEYTKRLQ